MTITTITVVITITITMVTVTLAVMDISIGINDTIVDTTMEQTVQKVGAVDMEMEAVAAIKMDSAVDVDAAAKGVVKVALIANYRNLNKSSSMSRQKLQFLNNSRSNNLQLC